MAELAVERVLRDSSMKIFRWWEFACLMVSCVMGYDAYIDVFIPITCIAGHVYFQYLLQLLVISFSCPNCLCVFQCGMFDFDAWCTHQLLSSSEVKAERLSVMICCGTYECAFWRLWEVLDYGGGVRFSGRNSEQIARRDVGCCHYARMSVRNW